MTEAIEVTPIQIESGRVEYARYQPRMYPVQEQPGWSGFVKSIEIHGGNYDPIHVVEIDGQLYCFIGHRRGLACEELKLPVNAIIHRNLNEGEIWSKAIGSNTARAQMTRAEIILSVKKLVDEYSHTERDIVSELDLSLGTINNYLKCSMLEHSILEKIDTEELALTSAIEIAKLDQSVQTDFAYFGIAMDWTVDQFKEYVPIYSDLSATQRKHVLHETHSLLEFKELFVWKAEKFEKITQLLRDQQIPEPDHDILHDALSTYQIPEKFEEFRKKFGLSMLKAMDKRTMENKRAALVKILDGGLQKYKEYPDQVAWFEVKKQNALTHNELHRIDTLTQVVQVRIDDMDKQLERSKSRLDTVNDLVKEAEQEQVLLVKCSVCKQDVSGNDTQQVRTGDKDKRTCNACINEFNFALNLPDPYTMAQFHEEFIAVIRSDETFPLARIYRTFQEFAALNYIVPKSLIEKLEICCEVYAPSVIEKGIQLLCSDHNNLRLIVKEHLSWEERPAEYGDSANDEIVDTIPVPAVQQKTEEIEPEYLEDPESDAAIETFNKLVEAQKVEQKLDRAADLEKFVNRFNTQIVTMQQAKRKFSDILSEMFRIPELKQAAGAIKTQFMDEIPEFNALVYERFTALLPKVRKSIDEVFRQDGISTIGMCAEIMTCEGNHTGLTCKAGLLHVNDHEVHCISCAVKINNENVLEDMEQWYRIQIDRLIEFVKPMPLYFTRAADLSDQLVYNPNKISESAVRMKYNVVRQKLEKLVEEIRRVER